MEWKEEFRTFPAPSAGDYKQDKRVKTMKSKVSEGRKVSLLTASEARKSVERSEAGRQVGILQHHKYLPILLSGTFKSQQR